MTLKKNIRERMLMSLENGIYMNKAAMGNVQLFNAADNCLEIVVHKGAKKNFLEHFKSVKVFDSSACGRAFGHSMPIMINDVEEDIAFEPHREIARSNGFRSVMSMPLIGSYKKKLGVVSIHFSEPRKNWDAVSLADTASELIQILQGEFSFSSQP